MDYFELYGIPIGFKVDEKALKKKFYVLSKEFHPDFHTDKSEEEQHRMLELSTLNNEAYKVLKDFDKRMKYILDQKKLLQEGKDTLPQSFLMKMMDINETLFDLEMDASPERVASTQETINQLKKELYSSVEGIIKSYNNDTASDEELNFIKNYYLKYRYILRIQDNLDKFASAC